MQLFRYATIGQIEIEAGSEEEAHEKLNAMTADEVLAQLGGVECFDVIDLEEMEEEKAKEEAARQRVAEKLARRKVAPPQTELAEPFKAE